MRPKDLRVNKVHHAAETWRSPAQVDIDRLLYSPEFRRLSGVTQVVPPQVEYQFHDRLSHSVKVAQVASTLARQLISRARSGDTRASMPGEYYSSIPLDLLESLEEWVDPDYCYVAGLAHDIGHPPFGHAAEHSLQEYCESAEYVEIDSNHDDQSSEETRTHKFPVVRRRSFEGNAQSTRVVAELSFRTDEYDPGLNLTLRSMAAIAKYPWLRGQHPKQLDKLAKKWSFYAEEKSILEDLRAEGFIHVVDNDKGVVQEVLRWPEAEIMDWADDISYAVHDLEDFFRSGLIPLHQIAAALLSASDQVNWYTTDFDFVNDEEIRSCLVYIHAKLRAFVERQYASFPQSQQSEILSGSFKVLRHTIASQMPKSPFTGSRAAHAKLQAFGSHVIRYLSDGAKLVYRTDVKRIQLYVEPETTVVAEFYKALNKLFVIESAMLSSSQYGQSADIEVLCDSLFELSIEWLEAYESQRASRRLPPRLREYLRDAAEESELRDDFDFILTRVIDYVCSLSDFQAAKLASQLRGSADMGVLGGRWLDA